MRCAGLVLAGAAALIAGCSGGDESPAESRPSDAAPPVDGAAGGGDAAALPRDTRPPAVASAPSAEVVSETEIKVTWAPAIDDVSPASKIVYRVYVSETAGAHDFARPAAIAPAGSAGATLASMRSGRRYFIVVRAVDEAANEDANVLSTEVALTDKTGPSFDGARVAAAVARDAVEIRWAPARDGGDPAYGIRYRVYLATTSGGQRFEDAAIETGVGATSVVVRGLVPSTKYFAVVRAVDTAGNVDGNTEQRAATTMEGKAPKFKGVTTAKGGEGSVTLKWHAAQDDTTPAPDVVYEIFQASSAGAETYATPTFTTAPGATSFTVTGLTSPATYYFVVRARDVAGNADTNTTELSAATRGADATPPTFAGVTSVTSATPTTTRVTWAAAIDDVTPAASIVYDLYVAGVSGAQSFASPTFTSAPGVTSFTLTGLTAGATRFVVVRARDAAGNRDASTIEASATTPAASGDTTAPVWTSGPTVARVDGEPTLLAVRWPAASDAAAASAVRYHACAEVVEASCQGAEFASHIRATTDFGATSVYVRGLAPRTAYFVYVRAEDRAGNLEASGHAAMGVTATSFVANVAPWLADRCGGCHAYTYDALVNVPGSYTDATSGRLALVKPGDAARSYLYRKLTPAGSTLFPFSTPVPNAQRGDPMPSDGTGAIPPAEEAALREWIEQGAHER